MSSGNTLLVECNGGCFPHSILIMYYYLRTTIAIVFCQAVLFSITAVSPGHFMIIYEISCVWKKAVCSKFIYWKVAARLSFRKEGSIQKKKKQPKHKQPPKKPPPKPAATARLLAAFRHKTQILFLSTNRLTQIKLAGFPGIATGLFDWLVLMLWKVTWSFLQLYRLKNTWYVYPQFRRPTLLQDYEWGRKPVFPISAHSCEQKLQQNISKYFFFLSLYMLPFSLLPKQSSATPPSNIILDFITCIILPFGHPRNRTTSAVD